MSEPLPPPVTPMAAPVQGTKVLIDGQPFVFDARRGWVRPVSRPWATWKVVVLTVAGFIVALAVYLAIF